MRCYRALRRATSSIKGQLSKQVRKSELSEAQFAMLELLYREGTMTQMELADELRVSHGDITYLVEKLWEKKLVARRRRVRDRRYIVIGISSYGKWFMEFVEPGAVWTIAEAVKGLSEAEQEVLIEMCERVEQGVKDVGEYTEFDHMERERKLGLR